jgi:hypothetical protein
MNHTENWIGSQYRKVVYREYTNGEFVEIKARPPQEEHLQLLGMADFRLSAPSMGISLVPPPRPMPTSHTPQDPRPQGSLPGVSYSFLPFY